MIALPAAGLAGTADSVHAAQQVSTPGIQVKVDGKKIGFNQAPIQKKTGILAKQM
jgi:hypothetical protein